MSLRVKIKSLFSCRHILWSLTLKELKTKYVGSILGLWWAVITPLLIMGVIAFVFTKIIKIDIENFHVFALAGIIPWFFFSVSLSEAANSLSQRAQLLRQFTIPVIYIPTAVVFANFINFVFGLIFLIPLFYFFHGGIMSVLILLPLVLILHLFFTLGIGLGLACANVFFRDISHLLGIVLLFWLWMTPVFYSLGMIPAPYRWMYHVNPMATYIQLYRAVLCGSGALTGKMFLNAFLFSVSALLLGYGIFSRHQPSLKKRM